MTCICYKTWRHENVFVCFSAGKLIKSSIFDRNKSTFDADGLRCNGREKKIHSEEAMSILQSLVFC